jgi:flagellar protein FlaG
MDELRIANSSSPQIDRKAASSSQAGRINPRAVAEMQKQQAEANVNKERQGLAGEAGVSREDTKAAVQKLNDYVQNVHRSLQFDFDEDAGMSVITVVDRDTKEVIRQIPDEVAVELARNLNGSDPVPLFSTKV